MANRNFQNSKIYSMHAMPVLIDCNFIVDSTDSEGLGITSLKGPLVEAVYMNTSATPATDSPNPAAGTIVVQLQDNYTRLFSAPKALISSPNSGSDLKIDNSELTQGVAYTITTLGGATSAAWQALGLPIGIVPAVGVSFIANSVGAGANTSTSRVQATAAAGSSVATIEIVGDPNTSINPTPSANQGFGAQFILQCRDYAGAIVAPADGSKISLMFYVSNSSLTVQGE